MLASPERVKAIRLSTAGLCRKFRPVFGGVTLGLRAGGKGDDGEKEFVQY